MSNVGTRHEHVGTSGLAALSGAITASSSTITVADATGFPTGEVGTFYLTIGRGTANEEIVLCSSRAANTFTVAPSGRGASGSVARSHNTSETVEHAWVSDEADALDFHAAATGTVHGVASAVVGASDTQTLANKTINGTQNTLEAIPQSAVVSLVTDLGTKAASVHTHAEADVTSLVADLAAKQSTSAKGAASGYASLDGSTKVPIAQIPTGSTGSTVPLGNHTHAAPYATGTEAASGFTVSSGNPDRTSGLGACVFNSSVSAGDVFLILGTVQAVASDSSVEVVVGFDFATTSGTVTQTPTFFASDVNRLSDGGTVVALLTGASGTPTVSFNAHWQSGAATATIGKTRVVAIKIA